MRSTNPVLRALLTAIAVLASGQSQAVAQTFATLNDPLGIGSTASNGISGNNIVGQYYDSSDTLHGFIYNGSAFATLDDPLAGVGEDGGTAANSISGNYIVGEYLRPVVPGTSAGAYINGFLYNGSIYATLADPSGVNATIATGISGINVSGFYYDSSRDAHGFLYNIITSTYVTLNDPLAGSDYPYDGTEAGGISGSNVVGFYYDPSGHAHGFLYNGSAYTTLDDPLEGGGVNEGTIAEAISGNDIIGVYNDASDNVHGFLYNGSTYTTLDDPLGVGGTFPSGISGNAVVGYYVDASGDVHGFVATVPEPSSLVLFAVSAIGVALVARRRDRKNAA